MGMQSKNELGKMEIYNNPNNKSEAYGYGNQ